MTEYKPVEKTIEPGWGDGPDTVEIPTDALEIDVTYKTADVDAVAEPPLCVTVRYLAPLDGGSTS